VHEPNLLRVLLTQRHLLRYETFRRRFEAAARELAQREGDPRLGCLTVGERQFNRWLYGSLTGQPRPDACRVLEHLTGRSVVELFAPPPAEPVCPSPEPETPAGQSQATDAVVGSRVATGIHRAEGDDTDRRELLGLAAASLLAEATTRSLRRVQRLGSSNVSAATLENLDAVVHHTREQFEYVPASRLLAGLLPEREWVDNLLDGRQRLRDRSRLYLIAAEMSALLGIVTFDLNDFHAARVHCVEARALAEEIGYGELHAWVDGTQAMVELYAGHPDKSLSLARQGQQYARSGTQVARLACMGEARACGQLGDRAGVDSAVARAMDAISRATPNDQRFGGGSALVAFSEAQVEYYAGHAYLHAGDFVRARRHSERAQKIFDASPDLSPGYRSLSRVNNAIAIARSPGGDMELASHSVREALEISTARPVAPLLHRAHNFVTIARRLQRQPQHVEPVVTTLARWRAQLQRALPQ
jgi:tetratricopeptide (TPR) repeat protein